jgi:hypothetical protein
MVVKLEKPLRRELNIDGEAHVLTITPDGLKLTEKGRRKGIELSWKTLVSGDAALAVALRASVQRETDKEE